MCYSTCTSGPTCAEHVLSTVSSRQLSQLALSLECPRTVLYDAFYSYLCRHYWNSILGPSTLDLQRDVKVAVVQEDVQCASSAILVAAEPG